MSKENRCQLNAEELRAAKARCFGALAHIKEQLEERGMYWKWKDILEEMEADVAKVKPKPE